jgi:16S rRNA (uracil1498-N3)-methyltransferase
VRAPLYFWLPRVVVEEWNGGDGVIPLPDESLHHLKVRRVGLKGKFLITNGKGKEGLCRLVSLSPAKAKVEEVLSCIDRELKHSPLLAFAVVKDPRVEWAIKSAVETGMIRFLPVLTKRSLPKVSPSKIERWRRIALEAMKQCGGVLKPEVFDPVFLPQLQQWKGAFFSTKASKLFSLSATEDLELFLVGPEGGFDPEEEEMMKSWGWSCYTLGPRVLRTETAMVAVATILAQGEWSER